MNTKCPRCGSPDPKLHPAVQYEGEVQICAHTYHTSVIHDYLCRCDVCIADKQRAHDLAKAHGV